MKTITIRQMTRPELDTAVDWAATEGWNPGLYDAQVFWDTDPAGFVVIEQDGQMLGSMSIVSYGGKFSFGGFFIVRPELRGKGMGSQFLEYCRKQGAKLAPGTSLGIDGVFAMQSTYAKFGFAFSHRNLRMEGIARQEPFDSEVVLAVSVEQDFNEILALDRQCFGFDRSRFLRGWLQMPESHSLKYGQPGNLQGFGVARRCRSGYKIGPLFAQNADVARELFRGLSSKVAGEKIYLDVPEINSEAMKLAAEYGMRECFGCARMYMGPAPNLPYDKVFGVTTFELG